MDTQNELVRLKQECVGLGHKIDEMLNLEAPTNKEMREALASTCDDAATIFSRLRLLKLVNFQ